jgi:predicted aconitase
MFLTDEEKRMLNGERGEPLRFAMEMLSTLGEINDAEKMIPIRYAHVAGLSFKTHGIAGMEWAEDMADKGAKVVVPTTFNVSAVDRSRDLGQPEYWVTHQLRIGKAYERMGVYGSSSCVPYCYGYTPLLGESVAWAESSAVTYCNSVLGARDNREGGPSALAAALAGRTANYGMHRKENRYGDVLYKVVVPIGSYADYGALATYVGKQINSSKPVFLGLKNMTQADLICLSCGLATVSNSTMFHAVGITPESPTLEAAFGGKKNYDTIEFGKKELETGYQMLQSGKNRNVDYVAIGCPHANLEQIKEVAELLDGKKVKNGVKFLIHTSIPTKALAKQVGYYDIIEKSGAIVTQDFCTSLGDPEDFGVKVMATNSSRAAFYGPHNNGFDVWFGDAAQCVDAAVSGYWNY